MRILLTGLLITALQPGASADPAPTDVSVSWMAPDHQVVRIAWQETGSFPNLIEIQFADGTSTTVKQHWPASYPNEVGFAAGAFRANSILRVAVFVGTAEGGNTSDPGLSPVFDTLQHRPVVDDVAPGPGGSVHLRWHGVPSAEDTTPDDPLDAPPVVTYDLSVTDPRVNQWNPIESGLDVTQILLLSREKPFKVAVFARNEWGSWWYPAIGRVNVTRLSARVPGIASYGAVAGVWGTVQVLTHACDPGLCFPIIDPNGRRRFVVLQARTGARWASVATAWTDVRGQYLLTFRAIGTRKYRVVAVNEHGPDAAVFGVASAPVLSVTRARLLSARFLDPTVQYGHRATAYLKVSPALTARALLQRWNGARWVGVAYLPVRRGAGSVGITAVPRGAVGYRVVVPASTYAGLPITGLVTPNFFVTAR